MNEIYISNLEGSPTFDEKVWAHAKEILKSGGSMWYSPTRESNEICILDGGEYRQFAVHHEEGIGFDGAWELVNMHSEDPDLKFEEAVVVIKSNCRYYNRNIEFSFNTPYLISLDGEMWKHIIRRLVRRARQTKAEGGIAFMLLDGGRAVYIEDEGTLIMQWADNTLKVKMEGGLPFVSNGLFRLGDVMFYIPPENPAPETKETNIEDDDEVDELEGDE